ncbi:hypothetical protein GUJ93_ZPchr0005g15141 [Zizania palustris]|uniref:Proteasome subunit alpha type-3 n=1 Tax=Zizania palustris TaxID=103762 RepID=A0A8J5SSJ4_ZIZPA|nr:hypothetical protein GUJ93_ZPchr0005g15141 [Zizania palustris]
MVLSIRSRARFYLPPYCVPALIFFPKTHSISRNKPKPPAPHCHAAGDAAATVLGPPVSEKYLYKQLKDGRVFQVEYAGKAVDNSGTVVGIKCKDGIVLGVEKLVTSKMILKGSNRRVHSVHRNTGLAVAGLAADGRQIVARAKSEAANYEKVYGEPMPVKELADRVASYVHLCTLYWWLRPFGCGVILGGYDRDGPQLYMIEPSGLSYKYFGAALGKGRQAAKTEIEKLKLSELTCREGIVEVAKIIYGVHDEAKDKAFELELSWVCDESNRQHEKVPDDLVEQAKAAAQAALEEMDAD